MWFLAHIPVVYPAVFVLVCELKHLINVLLIDRDRKVPHHKLEISFAERLVLYLPLFCSKIRRIRIRPTNNLKCFGSFQRTLSQRSANLEKCLVKYFLVLLPVLPENQWELEGGRNWLKSKIEVSVERWSEQNTETTENKGSDASTKESFVLFLIPCKHKCSISFQCQIHFLLPSSSPCLRTSLQNSG